MNKEEIDKSLNNIKKKIYLDVDQNHLIKTLTELSEELTKLKRRKDYYDHLVKLLGIISEGFSESLDSFTRNVEINKIKKAAEENSRDLIKQIIIKSDKLDSISMLLDFLSFESFDEVVKIREK
ncbi:MAG: hypothetical protein U0457_03440 [Candidatus Sericytochromatia bacterium]